MTIPVNGKSYTPQDALIYWIQEREAIRIRKEEECLGKPWSKDRVFQTTYFCNVHREDDRVTRFVRNMYNPYYDDPMFVYNIVLARFLNWPDTLTAVGYQHEYEPTWLKAKLEDLADRGDKVWGGAYVITTHGQKMKKVDYLVDQVLKDVYEKFPKTDYTGIDCDLMSKALQQVDGIGSFLAAQVVADLKNTPGHALYMAPDKATFVEPGPGSIRGLEWYFSDAPSRHHRVNFHRDFAVVRKEVDQHWPEGVTPVDNQDLQNCLCEYDKYCRVATQTGRSKRAYLGT